MINVGSLANLNRQQVPPVKTPAVHQRVRPLTLNPLLDPACELCYLPIQGAGWHDYSESGNDGALVGAAWTANGRYGPAVQGVAAADRVVVGLAPNLMFVAGDFSIEIWFYLTWLGGVEVLFHRGQLNLDGYGLWVTALGAIGFHTSQALFNQTTVTVNGIVVINQWYHAVVRRQGPGVDIFANGFQPAGFPVAHVNPVGNPARVSDVGWNGGTTIVGFYDLVRVYSRWLGDQEILDLYNQGRPQWQ